MKVLICIKCTRYQEVKGADLVVIYKKRVAAGLLAFVMAASSFVPAGSMQAASKPKVKSISFSKPVVSTLALKKGESFKLKMNVQPKKAKSSIAFSTSKKSVVKVSGKGVLKAKKAGKATVTVTSTTRPKKKAALKVTVYNKLTKVKSISLGKTSAVLKEGERLALNAAVSPAKATVKKVVYVSSDKSVASVAQNGAVTAKKAGKADITAYAQDGRGAKAVLHLTVEAAGASNTAPGGVPGSAAPGTAGTPGVPGTSAPTASPGPGVVTPAPTERPPEEKFTIASAEKAVSLYVDKNGSDYDGLSLVAESFAGDVTAVSTSGAAPEIVTEAGSLSGNAIIVGSVGNNDVIDALIEKGKLDVSDIKGKWETYKIKFVSEPAAGVEKAIVVAGSDKRGAIYGLYHISEAMGVSPWIYWGDAVPDQQKDIVLSNWDLETTSKEPSVKFRGIFLNDEAPSLTSWVKNKFGNYNEDFYKNVYELILRCKGNYLWPAMWSNSFSEDGKTSPIANAELADKYGIVMGTSHHEPLCRAGVEWGRHNKEFGKNKDWDFLTNSNAIRSFWETGVARNKKFENVYTLGMRGEADSVLMPDASDQENIDLLKEVITVQKQILEDNDLEEAPKVLTVYKEVENFWHGKEGVEGLKKWNGLDDVTVMLCEDNNGNMRTLPTTKEEQERAGGWGMYYHFDYHGGPTSYEWVNTKELNKVWEQMTMAYEHGIDNIWIVNVGDLKPMEMNISYFLDMAYDYDTWGENGRNKTEEYMTRWVNQQFGSALGKDQAADLVSLLQEYTWLNGSCIPEALKNDTYHVTNYNEAREVLERTKRMIEKADKCKEFIPDELQAAYFQLVYFPTVASANVAQMQIYSGLNLYYYEQGSAAANVYADLLDKAIQYDKDVVNTYNNNMPGAGTKWQGMMSSNHVGFQSWNDEGWSYPQAKRLTLEETSGMLVNVEHDSTAYSSGECTLQDFTSVNQESYTVTVSNTGSKAFDYKAEAGADWIVLSKTSGSVAQQDEFGISVDWSKVPADTAGAVTLTGAGGTVTLKINAKVYDVADLSDHTYVYANGYASMLAGGYVASGEGTGGIHCETIEKYGKMGEAAKAFPTNFCFAKNIGEAPYVEYKVKVDKAGAYKLTVFTAPSNNIDRDDVGIRYGLSVNGGSTQLINTIADNYVADYGSSWQDDVKKNGRKKTTEITLNAGVNTIRVYMADPTFVLQKLVVSEQDVLTSHLGPAESYYKGKAVNQ